MLRAALYIVALALALALVPGSAIAQAAPAPAPAALTPAQKAKLAPRRPTRQIVGSPLKIQPAPVGALPIRPTPSNVAPVAPMPVPIVNCVGGNCRGVDGVQYNTGAAGVTVDPAGRTCQKVGTTMQCF